MKTIIIFITILNWGFTAESQTVSAQYEIKRTRKAATSDNPEALMTLNLTGYYYRNGSNSIFFCRPDYLKNYPDAIYQPGNMSLLNDSLQNITYANLDSLLIRYRVGASNGLSSNVMYNYAPDYRSWEIYDTVRIINGLPCKYATTKSRSGDILCEIWFYPEIEMPVSINTLINVPGLIVEGTYFNTQETFKLAHFDLDVPFSQDVFWPEYFNEPFKKMPDAIKK